MCVWQAFASAKLLAEELTLAREPANPRCILVVVYAFCVSTWLTSQHRVDLFSILDYIFSHGYNCFLILSDILGNHSFGHLQAYSFVIGQPVLCSASLG